MLLGIILAVSVFVLMNHEAIGVIVRYKLGSGAHDTAPNVQTGDEDATIPVDGDMDANVATATPNMLWIPAIGVETPIIYVETANEAAYQEALAHGVGHYPGTPEPGQPGNAYVFGHSSDFSWSKGSYKTVFALLPELEVGDIITASDRSGGVWNFRITETRIVEPDDLSVLDQHDNEKRMLTVQTSYPIGTALQRYVVVSELVGAAETGPSGSDQQER